MSVTLADIEAARVLLDGVAVRTPMEESRWLSAVAGGEVRIKAENLQRTGSFKARGAYVRLSRLSEEERARGVVAASAIPASSPPPPVGTTTHAASGSCSSTSRPTVPCPAMMSSWSKGWISAAPVRSLNSRAATSASSR